MLRIRDARRKRENFGSIIKRIVKNFSDNTLQRKRETTVDIFK